MKDSLKETSVDFERLTDHVLISDYNSSMPKRRSLIPTITCAAGILIGSAIGLAIGWWTRMESGVVMGYVIGFLVGAFLGSIIGMRMVAR